MHCTLAGDVRLLCQALSTVLVLRALSDERFLPEPGQAGQIVSVDDDVVESDRPVASMRGTVECISRTRTLLPHIAR
jgi:hypothetical protein